MIDMNLTIVEFKAEHKIVNYAVATHMNLTIVEFKVKLFIQVLKCKTYESYHSGI